MVEIGTILFTFIHGFKWYKTWYSGQTEVRDFLNKVCTLIEKRKWSQSETLRYACQELMGKRPMPYEIKRTLFVLSQYEADALYLKFHHLRIERTSVQRSMVSFRPSKENRRPEIVELCYLLSDILQLDPQVIVAVEPKATKELYMEAKLLAQNKLSPRVEEAQQQRDMVVNLQGHLHHYESDGFPEKSKVVQLLLHVIEHDLSEGVALEHLLTNFPDMAPEKTVKAQMIDSTLEALMLNDKTYFLHIYNAEVHKSGKNATSRLRFLLNDVLQLNLSTGCVDRLSRRHVKQSRSDSNTSIRGTQDSKSVLKHTPSNSSNSSRNEEEQTRGLGSYLNHLSATPLWLAHSAARGLEATRKRLSATLLTPNDHHLDDEAFHTIHRRRHLPPSLH